MGAVLGTKKAAQGGWGLLIHECRPGIRHGLNCRTRAWKPRELTIRTRRSLVMLGSEESVLEFRTSKDTKVLGCFREVGGIGPRRSVLR
jgi:hypothetical protein